jgi:hypothetical protein
MDIDAPYVMANDRFTDVSSKVISLPSVGNRRINRGSAGGVGKTAQHKEFIEIMEARPYIDTLLLDSEPDGGAQARMNQINLFVEAMAQAKADHILYGSNLIDGEVIDGFLTRYNSSSLSNVIKVGGSGAATTSLLLVEWDPKRCCFIYPKAVPNGGKTQALGISEMDNGRQRITDDDGNAFDALESVIRTAFGIRVLDDLVIPAEFWTEYLAQIDAIREKGVCRSDYPSVIEQMLIGTPDHFKVETVILELLLAVGVMLQDGSEVMPCFLLHGDEGLLIPVSTEIKVVCHD